MDKLKSVNPFSGEVLKFFDQDSDEDIEKKISVSEEAFTHWRNLSVSDRVSFLSAMADALSSRIEEFAEIMTLEMGKPIRQAKAEVHKCALVCRHYASVASKVLADETVPTDASQSFVKREPLGPLLAIMPWNFPLWQVFRFLAPALASGNTVLLKHASNVQLTAESISTICRHVGLPTGVFQNIITSSDRVGAVLANKSIKGVTLTGSNKAGEEIGRMAGQCLKPVVLELGGSNAFVVLTDADLDKAVSSAIQGRFQNNGQSCIAAKRILVHEAVYVAFLTKFERALRNLRLGNPMDESVDIGPLVSESAARFLEDQLSKSLSLGAQLVCGGIRNGAFFSPGLIVSVTSDMPVWRQETFGPLAVVRSFKTWEEAVRLSNESAFGLGVSVFTALPSFVLERVSDFEEGSVFINSIVKSDPRLPFGGVKASGLGRELGNHGLLSFVNTKTIYVA